MSLALQWDVPESRTIAGNAVGAVAVGTALYVLGEPLGYAAAVAVGFFGLNLGTDLAEAVVGDYAGNAVFGLLVLVGTGYAATLTAPLWIPALGAALGGWFLLDGVQHLRHGVTRDEVGVPYRHEGSVLTGLPKALLVRLAEPFLLSRSP
ncbi:hypothetical protein [Haloarcula laminariae]|uniref:hypothetical protein n=1 Tax=Haloarcula laminariae TaxID=2961577 RepID=UPI002404A320|nr:hypothetical protein [Halomicroarcula sp. FL173]